MDRDAEIAQLNRELQILQGRRTTEERSRRRLTVFFMCLPVVCIGIVLTIIFQDPMAGLFAGGLMLLMGAAAVLPYALGPKGRRIVGALFGYFDFEPVSGGLTTDEQIAERERR